MPSLNPFNHHSPLHPYIISPTFSPSSHHKYSSTMKVHVSSGSNRTPIKEKLPIINDDVAVKPQCVSPDVGSTEETFFDSQAWLESDCESDFMSVNGEFTPSRGNTPVHHNFATAPPQTKGGAPVIDDRKPSVTLLQPPPSPVKKKKRLSELFSESQREGRACDDENGENGAVGSLEVVAVRGDGWRLCRRMVAYRRCRTTDRNEKKESMSHEFVSRDPD